MRRKKIAAAAVLLIVLVFLGVNVMAVADEFAGEARSLSVLSVSGDSATVTRGGGREVKAAAGMPLGQGSRAKTGSATNLYLKADEDKTIKLGSSTLVEIAKASSKKLGITLKSGEIFFDVEEKLAADEEMEFSTAQTSLSIRGTSGFLRTEENGQVLLHLLEGSVEWKAGEKMISLDAGQAGIYIPAQGMREEELVKLDRFTWEDLSGFELETLLKDVQDIRKEDLGLNEDQIPAAEGKAEEMIRQEESRAQTEESQAESFAQEYRPGTGEGGIIVEGREPVAEGDRDDEEVILEEPSEEQPTEEESTEEPTEEVMPQLIGDEYGYYYYSTVGDDGEEIITITNYTGTDVTDSVIREAVTNRWDNDGEILYYGQPLWVVSYDGEIYAWTEEECLEHGLYVLTPPRALSAAP